MNAIQFLDVRRILRFSSYTHPLPVVSIDQMQFDHDPDPDNGDELGILWLRPKENYPFYLRKNAWNLNQKQTVPKEMVERQFDGDPTGHVVAVAILRHEVQVQYGVFNRRVWFVKSYDAFHGYRPYRNRNGTITWYDHSGPCEAVCPQGVYPNFPDISGWNDGDRQELRPWDGRCQPEVRDLDFSVVPAWQVQKHPHVDPYWKKFGQGLYQMYVRRGKSTRQWYYVSEDKRGDWRAVRNGRGCSYETLGRYSTSKEAKGICEEDYRLFLNAP